jgi:hypothetical protein
MLGTQIFVPVSFRFFPGKNNNLARSLGESFKHCVLMSFQLHPAILHGGFKAFLFFRAPAKKPAFKNKAGRTVLGII